MFVILHQILHFNEFLPIWMQDYGSGIYFVLFLILFCETGLVVTPFLPGDSLLFALGALSASTDQALDFSIVSVLLVAAAFIGDNLNYTIGRLLGHRVLAARERPWLRKENIYKTQAFMQRYGRPAIVLARFVPIVRTFTPFVAGLGEMNRKAFLVFSLTGAVLWTQIFLWLGRFFGQNPFVKQNFGVIVIALIVLPGLPVLYSLVKSYRTGAGSS